MRDSGMTKARSMGPVAAAVQRAGGSVPRLFRRAELPLRLIDHPDYLIPLRDQLKLVEFASREIGDAGLAARLSLEGGVDHLGAFGQYVCGAPTLNSAIARCNAHMSSMLQSATRLRLLRTGYSVRWMYWLTDSAEIGRQKNEILALGYMLDLVRRYAGGAAVALRAEVSGRPIEARAAVQDQFGCEFARGEVASLVFPASYLEYPNPVRVVSISRSAHGDLPDPSDLCARVGRLIVLGLLEGRPTEEWICRRLRTSRRSMQRAIGVAGTSFQQILCDVLSARAADLVTRPDMSVTQIALELGYSDTAHFTRAFIRWFGESPRSWRRRTSRSI
jgi:AraC-like DNA-binding protein